MADARTRRWIDYDGTEFEAPVSITCDGRHDRLTHYLFAPHDPWMFQPLTLCGFRAWRDGIPGGETVTCRTCKEARD